jgi:uncharacterized protein (TIGR02145 family)
MKKLFTLIMVILITSNAFTQSPQKMSYQCVVRNASGVLVINQSVGIRISILQGTAFGTMVYQEIYNPNPQSNVNGLISIEIGGGIPIIGTFSTINWASGSYFLKTEIDLTGGTNYTIIGTSQLLSVPYALYSRTTGNVFSNDLLVNGLTVGRGNGAIATNAAFGNQALYSNTTGNFNTATGTQALFLNTTGYNNTTTGYAALYFNTTGYNNTSNGYAALYSNTTGSENTASGRDALGFNTTGQQNTATGYRAILNNTEGHGNTANGYQSGYTNTNGNYNVFLGYEAGFFETGSNKLFIDNQRRANESDARTKSLIYGTFDTNPANQVLTINGNVNVNNNKITNVANPVNAKDAATKDYVDAMQTQIEMLKNTLKAGGIVTDIDGNPYCTVIIGTQTWMAENLKTTKYNDGTPIPKVTDAAEWGSLLVRNMDDYSISGAYCWYNNDSLYEKDYGKLYNFGAVATSRLCPVGWHVPNTQEWRTLWLPYKVLENPITNSYSDCYELMESGMKHWITGLGTNETGFTAMPGGYRSGNEVINEGPAFVGIGITSLYWSSGGLIYGSFANYLCIPVGDGYGKTPMSSMVPASRGLSVRCLKDN